MRSSRSLARSLARSLPRGLSFSLSLSLPLPCRRFVRTSLLCSLPWRREHVRGGHLSQASDFAQNATMQMHLCGGRHCSGRVGGMGWYAQKAQQIESASLRRRCIPVHPACTGGCTCPMSSEGAMLARAPSEAKGGRWQPKQ